MKHKKQLMILPFDHRSSFTKNLLGFNGELTEAQNKKVKYMKETVYLGFRKVLLNYKERNNFGILVDEQFGREIYNKAKKLGAETCETIEKSGKPVFDFEYGKKYSQHIERVDPTYVKVLVRYNPANKEENKKQILRLKKLSNYCMKTNRLLLFELLVPPTDAELKSVKGNKKKYDKTKRVTNTIKAIKELSNDLYVDIWKLEGFDSAKTWQNIIDVIKQGQNKDDFGIVLLGRGENKKKVISWLKLAAKFPKIIGFAVGRTIFFEPLEKLRDKKFTREKAVNEISKNFQFFVNLWLKEKGIKLE